MLSPQSEIYFCFYSSQHVTKNPLHLFDKKKKKNKQKILIKNEERRTEKRKVSINSVVLTVLITFENILSNNNNTTCIQGEYEYVYTIITNPFADKSNILSQGKLKLNDKNGFYLCLPFACHKPSVLVFHTEKKARESKYYLEKCLIKLLPLVFLYLMDFCFDCKWSAQYFFFMENSEYFLKFLFLFESTILPVNNGR